MFVYDSGITGLESGRYCETLGWLSMSGIKSSNSTANMKPRGVPNPTQKATKKASTATATAGLPSATANSTANSTALSNLVYSRRYLDWNRLTFAYHAVGSQSNTFDYYNGRRLTYEITDLRKQLNLTTLYGCAPQTYCISCRPFEANGNIFTLLEVAVGAVVINQSRANIPRLIILNTGSVRFDLVEGPFTYDDSFIVSPFTDAFQYIANVDFTTASQVLAAANAAPDSKKRRDLEARDFHFTSLQGDSCVDAVTDFYHGHDGLKRRSEPMTRGKYRRQTSTLTPGYVTTGTYFLINMPERTLSLTCLDDFGTDGDDTIHSKIPSYPQPQYFQGNGSLPTSGSRPATVDLVFLDYIAPDILAALTSLGAHYTMADVDYYLPKSFTTNSYLPVYAKQFWQANVPNCPVGLGVGSS